MSLKVLHICDHLGWPGSRMHGAKRILEVLLPRFDRSRYQTSLACIRHGDAVDSRFDELGVPVTYLGRGKFDPRILLDLLGILRRDRIQVVHAHGYGASTFGRVAGAMLGIPCIIHEHANLPAIPRYQALADAVLAPLTDYVIAVSESTREFCVSGRRMPKDRVHVHYFGVSLEEFQPLRPAEKSEARAQLGLPEDAPIVGTVTRLHEQKGVEYLIEAARKLVDAQPEVLCVIAGEGPLETSLRERARSLGLGDQIRFLGFVDQPRLVYAAADVIVFSSLFEGTPLTMFEAMAMGVPMIASAVDGIREVLTDGHDALLVPPMDVDRLFLAMRTLLNEPARTRALAAAALSTSKRYDVDAFVADTEALYEHLAANGARGARRVEPAEGLHDSITPAWHADHDAPAKRGEPPRRTGTD